MFGNDPKHTQVQVTYRLRKEYLAMEKFSKEVKSFDGKECFITYFKAEAGRRYRKKEIELKTFQNANVVLLQVMAFDNLSLFKSINKSWHYDFKLWRTLSMAVRKKTRPVNNLGPPEDGHWLLTPSLKGADDLC